MLCSCAISPRVLAHKGLQARTAIGIPDQFFPTFVAIFDHKQSSKHRSKWETVSSVSSPMLEKRTFRL